MPLRASDLTEIDIEGSYGRFYDACNLDIGKSYVEWIMDNTFINGQPIGFEGYEYLVGPINDLYPRQAIVKPAQKGASEAMARKMFAILHRYGLCPHYYDEDGVEKCVWGINGIYSFPNTDDVRKFSKDRLMTDIVNPSPALYGAKKASESEAVDQIGIYNSFCYMTGRRSDAGNQSIPAEVVFIDEYDRPLTSDRKIVAALNARTQNARIFRNPFHRGLIVSYGTPTLPDETGVLIDGLYYISDQMQWLVKCTHCGDWQDVIYPDSIAHFYDRGEKPGKDPYWMCLKCKEPLDFSGIKWDRREPHKVHGAEWVAKFPERTKHGDGIRGYRIPFATAKDSAKSILMKRDTDYKFSIQDFYNYGLGLAYRDNSIGLVEENFLKSTAAIPWGFRDETYPHIMAFDQGAYVTIARLKPDSQTERNPKGTWQLMWAEYTPESVAFSRVMKDDRTDETKAVKGRLAELIEYWKPAVVVGDHLPNTAAAESLADEYKGIVWLNDSKGNNFSERLKIEREDSFGNEVLKLTENKHLSVEQYFDEIRNYRWEYPSIPDIEEFAKFKAHHKNVKKIVDDKSFKYVALGGPDHYTMSGKLLSEAAEIYSLQSPMIMSSGYLGLAGFQMAGA